MFDLFLPGVAVMAVSGGLGFRMWAWCAPAEVVVAGGCGLVFPLNIWCAAAVDWRVWCGLVRVFVFGSGRLWHGGDDAAGLVGGGGVECRAGWGTRVGGGGEG